MDMLEEIAKAKVNICTKDSAFISYIIFNLKHTLNSNIPTARTNGAVVEYNPEFMESLTPSMREFVVLHECWHVALAHPGSFKSCDPETINKAADYVINQLIKDSGNYEMPVINGKSIALQDDKFKNMSIIEIYNILIDEEDNTENPMNGDIKIGDSEDEEQEEQNEGNGANNNSIVAPLPGVSEEQLNQLLVKATMHSKMSGDTAGTVPGEVERHLEDLRNSKLNWKQILAKYINKIAKNKFTWTRPNKRFFPDHTLPSLHSKQIGSFVIAMDTSCSRDGEELNQSLAETAKIISTFKPKEVIILDCDCRIHYVHRLNNISKLPKLKFSGDGGTSFDPVIKYTNELKVKPLVLIYFTDLYARELRVAPKGYPIIWICDSKHEPHKLGKTIYIE